MLRDNAVSATLNRVPGMKKVNKYEDLKDQRKNYKVEKKYCHRTVECVMVQKECL